MVLIIISSAKLHSLRARPFRQPAWPTNMWKLWYATIGV